MLNFINLATQAKRSLWIGTADIKDLYVIQGRVEKPFLGILAELIGRGVEIRLIHAKDINIVLTLSHNLKKNHLFINLCPQTA